MWARFVKLLRCPNCQASVTLRSFSAISLAPSARHLALAEEIGVPSADLTQYVESGVLLCDVCRIWFPIFSGLPVMLCYATPIHEEFARAHKSQLARHVKGYEWPVGTPAKGELAVMRSFSEEWREYKYDGVLWHNCYEDLEETFLSEISFDRDLDLHESYLEVGCGIGVTTSLAQEHLQGEAVGVDLSFACMQAAQHYRSNPFMHFVQASAFHLPFARRSFGYVYSRGVLHHTFSTREAFRSVAQFCREGGAQYVWVYGPGSNNDSIVRRVWYGAELVVRPVLSRWPTALPAKVFLSLLTFPYRTANWFQRLRNPAIQRYTYERAVHAARDRFTPRYAHRHPADEVQRWFREAGFENVTLVDWRQMPVAQQDTFRRNVGVRGRLCRPSPPTNEVAAWLVGTAVGPRFQYSDCQHRK
jgi:ubiquinone/menaquinone biosynthesis C-methylase UbiE/uncharacterized protein YbaR (Trm112 family)